jgi:hypothetical protein
MRVFVLLLTGGVIAGCVGTMPIAGKTPPLKSGGNVVVSFHNGTSKPVRWQVVLRNGGPSHPAVRMLDVAPRETESLAVEAPLSQIGGDADGSVGIGAVVGAGTPTEVHITYAGASLARGEDFADGDVIELSVREDPAGWYAIAAEVATGG